MSVDRCSHADEFQLHVLAASYCLIRTARCGLSYRCSYLHLARPAELQVTSVPTHNRHGGESRDGRTLPWLSCPPLSRTPWSNRPPPIIQCRLHSNAETADFFILFFQTRSQAGHGTQYITRKRREPGITQASGARHRVMSVCQHRQTFLAHQGSAQGTRSPVDAAAPRETLQDFLGVMRRSVESRPRRHRNQVASHPTLPSHLREKGENTQKLCP